MKLFEAIPSDFFSVLAAPPPIVNSTLMLWMCCMMPIKII